VTANNKPKTENTIMAKIKVTKTTIHDGKIHQEGSTPEIGKDISRKSAEALLEAEHATKHDEPEPERAPQQQQQQQQRPQS
jgi:hypothetical protein